MKRRFGWQRGRRDIPEDVRREIDFHVAEHVRELMARGASEPDARAQARTAFGDRGTIESELNTLRDETLRTRQRRDLVGNVLLDARIALRGLRRNPGFAVAACLTIALAIGANTAVFSVVRSVLLRPLPYPAANQLVQLWTDYRVRAGRTTPEWLTPPGFADWRDQNRSFTAMGAYQGWGPVLTGAGEPASLNGLAVSGDFFRVLAIPPLRGRTLAPADDDPGAAPVAVLSYSLWSTRFGSDPSVIDRSITLDGESWRVVGVMPATFRAPVAAQPVIYRTMRRPANGGCGRGCIVLRAVGRLKPGVSFAQAQADIGGIARREAELYPASNRGVGAWLIPLHEQITGPTREPLLALSAAVALVLLIACVNVANLLLLRGAAREREFGVRAALGAGRGRLIGQLMTENGMLALAGGALGLALGVAGAQALSAIVPPGIRGIQSIGIDGDAVGFSVAATVLSAILFGLLPSLQAARRDLMELLRTSVGNVGHRRSGARQHLVSVQLVLAMVLVVGAGLLLRSLVAMQQVDLGYRQGGLLLEGVTLPPARYTPDRIGPAMIDLAARLRGRTGIRNVEVTDLPPLSPGDQDMTMLPLGETVTRGAEPDLWYRVTSPGYLQLMHQRLVAGRYFTAQDRDGTVPVIIVNEEAARRIWPGKSAVGRVLATGPDSGAARYTVVGVVATTRPDGPHQPVKSEVFIPLGQIQTNGFTLMIEPSRDPADAFAAIRATLHDFDPLLPVEAPRTLESVVGDVFVVPRLYTVILGAFAVMALLLAAVGVYGVMAYAVAQRQREIGVRLALGASPRQIRTVLLWRGMRTALMAVVAGLVIAVAGARLVRSLLFGIDPADPMTLAGAAVVLAGAALLACWFPARRAMRVDPLQVMRQE